MSLLTRGVPGCGSSGFRFDERPPQYPVIAPQAHRSWLPTSCVAASLKEAPQQDPTQKKLGNRKRLRRGLRLSGIPAPRQPLLIRRARHTSQTRASHVHTHVHLRNGHRTACAHKQTRMSMERFVVVTAAVVPSCLRAVCGCSHALCAPGHVCARAEPILDAVSRMFALQTVITPFGGLQPMRARRNVEARSLSND